MNKPLALETEHLSP